MLCPQAPARSCGLHLVCHNVGMLQRAALAFSIALLTACSSTTPTTTSEAPKKAEPPPEPITGRQAFQHIYPSARAWQPDAQPLQMQSINLDQVKSTKGRAGAWQVTFVSLGRGLARTWTYSVIEGPGALHQGVFSSPQETFSGRSGQQMPFSIAAIKKDSDTAYEVAAQHAADYLKKNPDKPVTLLLEYTKRFPDLTWRVMWGESVATSEYSVFVDASTGAFLERIR